ncbi:MAG: thioesterase family protein [Synechococcales bacterium]|nr:thioesterase family protein [Synechococcales bacterium]
MGFCHERLVQFGDTDMAGVLYFANGLRLCHEAYEASLQAAKIDLRTFFLGTDFAVPIASATIQFLQPIYCGDRLWIELTVELKRESEFTIHYQLFNDEQREQRVAEAETRHVCIYGKTRKRRPLPDSLQHWLNTLG